jgi:hypothetical protein
MNDADVSVEVPIDRVVQRDWRAGRTRPHCCKGTKRTEADGEGQASVQADPQTVA